VLGAHTGGGAVAPGLLAHAGGVEEERRMLQMAHGRSLARGERAQRGSATCKAEMEAFLRSKDSSCHSSTMWEARFISDAAAAASAELRSKIICVVNLMTRLDKTSTYFSYTDQNIIFTYLFLLDSRFQGQPGM